ncbi:GerAB/ArcD/ProY family transporter [Alkalihalobacterium alkalinitrilicum]|uniref:GerAB/ArcD/ProY family transporter n=1 Tax=Alkalihalobacterium alkalinitrilicum TaxID=427920 RepID=UPI001303153D|nr:GerAB/ArcD/ProY family transporter [Alkalihalobacterium alkalinitrilicum]
MEFSLTFVSLNLGSIHNLFIIALVARVLGITVNSFLLDDTPVEIIVSVFLLTVTYCVSKGVQGVIHINIMLLPIILVILFGMFLFAGIHFDPTEITPVLSEGIIPIFNGSFSTSHPFVGGLYFFFMLMAYFKKEDLRSLPINLVSVTIPFIYMIIIILSYGVLGFEITKATTFPLMEVVKTLEVPGGFIERLDSIFLTVWILALFTTVTISMLITVLVIKDEFLKDKKAPLLLPTLVFISFILTFFPDNLSELERYSADLLVPLGFTLTGTALTYGFLTIWLKNNNG